MVNRNHRSIALAAGGVASTVVGVFVPAERAEALSCGCSGATYVVAPQSGATDVPIDTFVWFAEGDYYYGSVEQVALISTEGEQVELEIREIDAGADRLHVAIPVETLAPNTLYQAFGCDAGTCDRLLTEFRTGSATDEDAPALPTTGQPDRLFESGRGLFSCGRMRALEFAIEHDGILVADLGDATLDAEALAGSVTAASSEPQLMVGVGLCDDIWSGAEDETLEIRFGLFDLSGNFSGWTEPEPVELPKRGCSIADEQTPAAWAWGLLLLAAVRRRNETQ